MVRDAHLRELFARQETLHPVDHYLTGHDARAEMERDNAALRAWFYRKSEAS